MKGTKETTIKGLEKHTNVIHAEIAKRLSALEDKTASLNVWNIGHTKDYNKTVKIVMDGLENIKKAIFCIFILNLIVSAAITYWMIS